MRRIVLSIALLLGGTMAADAARQLATFETSKGTIVCELFGTQTPITVKNFVGLATGTKEYKDVKTGQMKKGKYYDGLIFHRVIPAFMIQGGDPEGSGRGGPGYQFEDEFVDALQFDKPGKLAMANSGPGTNGSQFFITAGPTPHLNGRHTIFGQVIKGQDIVTAITQVDRDANDRPRTPVVIKSLTIKEEK